MTSGHDPRRHQAGGGGSAGLVHHLHEQLDWHWRTRARPRLDGLTDDEYLWEPAVGSWNLRRREVDAPGTVTVRAGAGGWLLDFGYPEPSPAPVTSIAWRLGHVVVGVLAMRSHSHFDAPPADYETWTYAATAAEALHQLDDAYAHWSAGVAALAAEELWQPVGPAEGPWAEQPMITLVLHINRETIHHLAEVALLRDLWAHQSTG
ncbi:DinB family protein [Ornithinimicrobium sp. LYQ121]|uniref:DinB family protein n=1 Tax=Ornithinimicrobium sp. LYQ121 TaxID=3378801 RepID=UPI00385273FB